MALRRLEEPRRDEQGPERGGLAPVQRLSLSQSSSLTLTTPPAKETKRNSPNSEHSQGRRTSHFTPRSTRPTIYFLWSCCVACGILIS